MFIDKRSDIENGRFVVVTAQWVRWRTDNLRVEGSNTCRVNSLL